MRLPVLRSCFTIASLLLVSSVAMAQTVYSPDVTRVFVSGFMGLNHNTNMGDFKTDCDCLFEGSLGLGNIGAQLGADITYAWSPSWAVIAKAYYDNKHTVEEYERDISTPIATGQEVLVRSVRYNEIGDVSLSYLTFGLFLRWQPRLARWYVYAGPTAGVVLASEVQHKQEIVDPELSYRELLDTKREVSTGEVDGLLRLEAAVGFGYDYIIRPRWYLNPEIRVGYPLTKVTETITDRSKDIAIDDWKVMSVQFSIGLKYEAF
ncbi:MAG TPA: outer membrane beta-barrel protein [Bacteroidota bacterium]|nr:outer membrane beta-barrel protein [Bacteroidota bacterium]